eukprot:5093245-Prymnesium_polylepis.2
MVAKPPSAGDSQRRAQGRRALCEKLSFRNWRWDLGGRSDKGVSWLAGAVAFVSPRFFFGPDGVRLAGAATL